MKKYFFLFISIFLLSCASKKQQSFSVLCPELLFSKDHRIYIATEENSLTLNNISYKAVINNYKFPSECFMINNKVEATLSILFTITPDKAKLADIIIPYYIALLDDQKNIVNIQYYKATGTLKKNDDKYFYVETEIRTTQNVTIPVQDMNVDLNKKLLLGFMLNQDKLKILN